MMKVSKLELLSCTIDGRHCSVSKGANCRSAALCLQPIRLNVQSIDGQHFWRKKSSRRLDSKKDLRARKNTEKYGSRLVDKVWTSQWALRNSLIRIQGWNLRRGKYAIQAGELEDLSWKLGQSLSVAIFSSELTRSRMLANSVNRSV
jgi:hypothetical protein